MQVCYHLLSTDYFYGVTNFETKDFEYIRSDNENFTPRISCFIMKPVDF